MRQFVRCKNSTAPKSSAKFSVVRRTFAASTPIDAAQSICWKPLFAASLYLAAACRFLVSKGHVRFHNLKHDKNALKQNQNEATSQKNVSYKMVYNLIEILLKSFGLSEILLL